MPKFENCACVSVSKAVEISEETEKRGIGEIVPSSVFVKRFPSGAIFIGWEEYNGET